MASMLCKVCDQGTLVKRRKYRTNGIVALLGWLLLLGSLIPLVLTVSMFCASVASVMRRAEQSMAMGAAHVPEGVSTKVLRQEPISDVDRDGLSDTQMKAVRDAEGTLAAQPRSAGFAGVIGESIGLFIAACSFGGMVIGCLLVMKKTILQCRSCGAVVPAS